jgi:hypothetical protein
MRPGDTLTVWKVDRLARSIGDRIDATVMHGSASAVAANDLDIRPGLDQTLPAYLAVENIENVLAGLIDLGERAALLIKAERPDESQPIKHGSSRACGRKGTSCPMR